MPVSTTLKLPEHLKKRLGPLAKSAGKTPHAWIALYPISKGLAISLPKAIRLLRLKRLS